jgi:hypothetical protein
VTHLRQLRIEELQRRNFAETTIRSYVHLVEHFAHRDIDTQKENASGSTNPLSFRAAVKTDAGVVAAANTDGSKVRFDHYSGATEGC